jgi:hypothetical protein
MSTRPAKLLCAGEDSALLETRFAVLKSRGYEAKAATVEEAGILLRTEFFEIVIVSARLAIGSRTRSSRRAINSSPVLTELVLAALLLVQADSQLSAMTSRLAAMDVDVLLQR